MRKIRQFVDPNTPFEKSEQLMSELLKEKFDQDLKKHYISILETKYKYHKESELNVINNNALKSKLLKLTSFAAIFILLILTIWYVADTKSIIGSKDKVNNYLVENTMFYNDTYRSKSNKTNDPIRNLAYKNINSQNYKVAIANFDMIEVKTIEDIFYDSYSKLNLTMYRDAYIGFSEIVHTLQPSDKYYHETQLYYALSLFALNFEDDLRLLLNEWKFDSWELKQFNNMKDVE